MEKIKKIKDFYRRHCKKFFISMVTSGRILLAEKPTFAAQDLTANTSKMGGLSDIGMLVVSIIYGVCIILAGPVFGFKLISFGWTYYSATDDQERSRGIHNFKNSIVGLVVLVSAGLIYKSVKGAGVFKALT